VPTLDSKLAEAVGGRTAKALEKGFGMVTVGDLLAHYPRRLAERGELTDIASLQTDDEVTVVADVLSSNVRRSNSGPRLEVVVGDGRAKLQLVFFGKAQWRAKDLVPGRRGLFSGKVGEFRGARQLVHPEYLLLSGDELDDTTADVYAGRLIPVYPATKSVRTWVISSAVRQSLDVLDPVPEPLEPELRARRGLLSSDAALRAMHEPDDYQQWHAARRRMTWDEAMGVQLVLAQRRWSSATNPATPRPARAGGLLTALL